MRRVQDLEMKLKDLEKQLDEANKEMTRTKLKLAGFARLELPCDVAENELTVDKGTVAGKEVLDYTIEVLLDAFADEDSLWDVSTQVVRALREKEGGNWICNIQPTEVEDGLNFHKCKYMRFNFQKNDLQYCIVVACVKQRFKCDL